MFEDCCSTKTEATTADDEEDEEKEEEFTPDFSRVDSMTQLPFSVLITPILVLAVVTLLERTKLLSCIFEVLSPALRTRMITMIIFKVYTLTNLEDFPKPFTLPARAKPKFW